MQIEHILLTAVFRDMVTIADQPDQPSAIPFTMRLTSYLQEKGVSDEQLFSVFFSGMEKCFASLLQDAHATAAAFSQVSSPQEVVAQFHRTYPGLVKDTTRKALIVGTCIHYGSVAFPLIDQLHRLGFTDVRLGVVSIDGNESGFVPNVWVGDVPECYPLGRDTLVEKQPDRLTSQRVTDPLQRRWGYTRRREIRRIFATLSQENAAL